MKGVELQLMSVGIVVVSVALAICSAVVYRGWLFESSTCAVTTRRRLYWHQMRPGISGSWLQPAVVPFALSWALLGVCGFFIGADEDSRIFRVVAAAEGGFEGDGSAIEHHYARAVDLARALVTRST